MDTTKSPSQALVATAFRTTGTAAFTGITVGILIGNDKNRMSPSQVILYSACLLAIYGCFLVGILLLALVRNLNAVGPAAVAGVLKGVAEALAVVSVFLGTLIAISVSLA